LIAIDGSEQSLDAVDYAIDIAQKYDTELYALYVLLPCIISHQKCQKGYTGDITILIHNIKAPAWLQKIPNDSVEFRGKVA